ncbi:phosphatidylinositol phosphatase PTPRQ isoform X2 [Procambarus clarkii]|uniref:phosphatidylinositol phosphatase PTPRQ isoform X2 n=1 Tax=Procambarus clarkii TaxID=6728 RepID=UPI001E675DB2|nr:phosphatidylinositol phosphatase PTPRQ-like isoform X2 [Procambarus clarkii]
MIAEDKAKVGPGGALPGQSFTTGHSITGHTNMLWRSGRLLVLAALLTAAAAALDTEEIQKEKEYLLEAGRGPPENVAVIATLSPSGRGPPENVAVIATMSPSGRGPPENVAVVEVLINALNVSWDPPEEEPFYYTVEDGINNKVTHDNFFFIEGLQPCTRYFITVTSVYEGIGYNYPASTVGYTDISVPPAPPSCWFDNIDTTSLSAYWSDPSIQCTITNHNINWTSNVLWNDDENTSGTVNVQGYHYRIRNLKPYTKVTVSVAAATDAGYGPSTSCWNVTLQDSRGPPENLAVVEVLINALNVSWDPPGEVPTHYKVEAGPNKEDTHDTFFFIKGLQPCTHYSINVTSVYEDTGETYPASTDGTTDISVPPAPPSCWFDNIDTTSLTAYWSDPPIQCPVTNHNMSWTSHVLWNDEEDTSGAVRVPGDHYTLRNLKPYTNLTVSVAAATDAGYGPSTSCWNVTLQDSRGPPENLAVVEGLINALNVSWDPPREEPSYYRVEAGSNNEITHDTFFFIEGLQPCTHYSITVTSIYEGSGQTYPAFTDGTTDISVPPAPPSCWFDHIDTTSLTAYWSDPPFQCPLTNHNISWRSHVLWDDEEDTSGAVRVPGDHYTLRNLRPYTKVTVSVAAATDAGYGPSTSCWNVTLQDIPGAPKITNVTSYERSLYVSWSPPEEANGVILQYVINIENDHFKSKENVTGSVYTATFSDIPACDSYDVTVHATTEAGAGPASGSWNIQQNGADEGSGSLPWSEESELCYTAVTSVPYTNYSLCVGVDGHVTDTGCCSVQTPQAEPGPPVITSVTLC